MELAAALNPGLTGRAELVVVNVEKFDQRVARKHAK